MLLILSDIRNTNSKLRLKQPYINRTRYCISRRNTHVSIVYHYLLDTY